MPAGFGERPSFCASICRLLFLLLPIPDGTLALVEAAGGVCGEPYPKRVPNKNPRSLATMAAPMVGGKGPGLANGVLDQSGFRDLVAVSAPGPGGVVEFDSIRGSWI